MLIYEEDYEKLLAIVNDVEYLDIEITIKLELVNIGIVKI